MKKNKQHKRGGIINTKYVFAKNNQVSIKRDKNVDKWYPVNFQWVPIIGLQNNTVL